MNATDKEPNASLAALGVAFVIAAGAVALFAVLWFFTPVGAQAESTPGLCQQAADWHFMQAMEAGPDAQEHVWAGMAAQQLEASGEACEGWQEP